MGLFGYFKKHGIKNILGFIDAESDNDAAKKVIMGDPGDIEDEFELAPGKDCVNSTELEVWEVECDTVENKNQQENTSQN